MKRRRRNSTLDPTSPRAAKGHPKPSAGGSRAAAARQRIAKLTLPTLYRAQPREQLFARLAAGDGVRLTWICGPPGAGKTTLIGTYLERSRLPVIWYRMDSRDSDPATFFYYLRRAAAAHAHRKAATLPLLSPEYRLDLPGFAARFFQSLFALHSKSLCLVLDNYQEAATSTLDAILMQATRCAPGHVRIYVTSRSEPPPDFASVTIRPLVQVLRGEDLRLLPVEARVIARAAGIADAQQIEFLAEAADGWAAGLRMLVGLVQAGTAPAAHFADAAREALYRYFAGEFFGQLSDVSQRILLSTAVLPAFTAEQAIELSRTPTAGRLISQLYQQNFFIDRRLGTTATFQYHALFRAFLRDRGQALLGGTELRQLTLRAARLLEADSQAGAALELYNEACAWDDSVRITLAQSARLIQDGRHQALDARIASLPEDIVSRTPWLQYWRGIARLPFAPPQGRESLERAYDGFALAGDAQACIQSCVAILYAIFLEWGRQHESDRWMRILEERMTAPRLQGDPAVDVQVLPALSAALMRHLGSPFVAQIMDRAYERIVEIEDVEQRVAALLTVGYYFAMRGQPARGHRLLQRVVGSLRAASLPPLAQLNLTSVELLYAHFVFDGDEYAANQAKLDHFLLTTEAYGIRLFHILVIGQGIYLALKADDTGRAEQLLAAASAALDPAREMDVGHFNLLKSAVSYTRGDAALAHEYALECLRIASANGHTYGVAQVCILLAHALWAMGRSDEAHEAVQQLLATARAIGARGLEYVGLLLVSYFQLEAGQADAGLAALKVAFGFGKLHGQMTPSPWCDRRVTHRLCETALLCHVESEFVCRTIEWLRLPARRADIESWPWPVRIYTLGRFRIVLQGVAVESFSKQQRRPLKLLKVLIASGGRDVKVEDLLRVVWQSDAQDPRAAFDMAMLRLRKLLGQADALIVHEGRVTLNEQLVWVDAWAIEARFADRQAVRGAALEPVLAQYQGHFLAEEGDEAWVVPMRDRLAAKYRAAIRRAARDYEVSGKWEAASGLYEMGLQVDNLTEEFYLRLMYCLQHLGRTSDALNVYHRCRHILSVVLRSRPSPETEQLHQRLIQS